MTGPVQKALVTGGTAGLGRAFCKALIAQGFAVTSLDLTAPERDCGFEHVACDLAQRHSVDFALQQAIRHGPHDLVVFNAGISATGRFEALAPHAHARVMAVNAEAPMVLCAGLMQAGMITRGGAIIFVSSLSHFTGYPGAASYAAAKDALAVYAASIRKPWRKAHDVRVTTAFPGPLRTAHASRHAPEGADEARRMAPQEAARLILIDSANGKAQSLPGTPARIAATAGRLAPGLMTRAMRKIIYDKLDREVED